MQEKTRGKLIYAIGILAFLVAVTSFVFSAMDMLAILQGLDWNFSMVLQSGVAYEMVVDLVFSALELAMGLLLIKQWREKERTEVYKTLSKLINAVVYASFVKVIFALVMSQFFDANPAEWSVNIVYCIIYLLYLILTSSTGTHLRKRKWMSLYITMLITSVFGVGFCVYDCISALKSAAEIVEIGTTFANTLIIGLIVVFSVGVVVYYAKNPEALWRDVLDGEDYDVVENKGGYERVKIYATRAQEGAINVFILVLYCLCAVVGVAGIVLYAIENDIGQYFGGTVQDLINNIEARIMGGDISEIIGLLVLLMLVSIYPILFISQAVGALQRKAESKVNVISIAGLGIMMVLLSALSLAIDVVQDFSAYRTLQWENYSIYQAILVVLYLLYYLTKRIYKNTTKEIGDGIRQGDSFDSHSAGIAGICLFSGIFSVVGLVVLFAMKYSEGSVCISYLLLAVTSLLAALGACLEAKYPFSEFEYAKRKLVVSQEDAAESVENTQEIA